MPVISNHITVFMDGTLEAEMSENPYNFALSPSSPRQETRKKKNFPPKPVYDESLGRLGRYFAGLVSSHPTLPTIATEVKVMVWQP